MRVAISGNIGVGKSTLCETMSPHGTVHYEDIDKEILDLFYSSSDKVGVELLNQFHFLNEAIKREIKSQHLDTGFTFFDRPLTDHIHVFAKTNLKASDYVTYNGFQEIFLNLLNFKKYDMTILLRGSDESILNRIESRDRIGENTESNKDYFIELNKIYNSNDYVEHLKNHADKVVIINTDNKTPFDIYSEVIKIVGLI
jgi:deoxyadenosine/deoxycytidine kinase